MDIPRTSPGTTIQMNSKDTMDFPGATTTPDVSPPNPDNTASSSNNEKQHLRNHKKGKSKSIKADEPPHVDHNDRISTKHEAKSKRRKSSKKALTDESQRQQFETNVTQENSSYLNQAFFLDQSGATALVQNTTVDFNRSDDFNTSAGEVNSSEVSAASPETPGTKANDSVDAEAEEPVKRKLKPQLTGVESSSRRKSKTRDVRIDASEALGKKSKTLVDGTAGATDPKGSTRRKTKQKPADDGDAEPTYSAPRRKSKAETPAETETPKKRKPKKSALDQNSDDNGEPSKDENGEPSKESPVLKSTKSFPESAKEQDRIDYDELSTEPQRQKLKKVCWTCAKHQDPNCNDYEVIPKETSIREAMRLCWECPDPDGDDFGEASPKGKRKCQKFGAMPKPPSLDVDDEYLDELQPEIMESISGINSPEKQLIIDNMLSDVVKASIAKDAMAKFQAIAESVDGFIQDDKSIERSPAGSAMHGFYDDEGTACSHFLNDCSEMTSESGLTSMTSTLPGSSQKSLLPALESELEPLPLYEAYTTSLADVSTTGGTDTTSTLNTEGNTLDGLTLNDSLDRLQVPEPPGSEKGGKHSIPWLNETALQRKSSVERNALKRASTRDLGLESSEPPNRRRSMLGNPVVPGGKGLPDYTRDVSLPADIALLPHVGNRISSTTLTNGLESGSIEADPNSFLYTVSWGAKKFNSVMMLATNNEESYRSLGGKAAKKSRVPLDEISEVDKGSKTTSRLCCLLVFALVVALPSLIIGITIPVLKKRKGCDCDVTVAPTSSPSLSLGGLATLLEQSPADESATFQGEKSPQSKAFDWIVAGSASHSLSTARIVQRYALATIYFSTGGDSWFVQSGWLSTEDECGWFSSDQEICNPDGELINLSLVYNSLGGMLPKELALLTKLQFLDLTGNSLSGSIPAALGGMSSLVSLTLSDNYITGSIPEALQSLDKLETLILSQNDLQSTIPTQLGLLQSLKFISLTSNAMSGTFPSEIGQLVNLRSVRLDNNRFFGSLPPEMGFLPSLEVMDLTNNAITGSMPSELGSLLKLHFLSLGSNAFQGSVPEQLGSLYNLIQLDLSDNDLIRSLSSTFGNLVALNKLDVSGNNLTGTVPLSLWQAKIEKLSLEGNGFSGVVPDLVCDFVRNTVGSVVRVSCENLSCSCCECIAVVDEATLFNGFRQLA